MKSSNSLSKAEMKKVIGGHPDTPYCMAGNACHVLTDVVPDWGPVDGICVMEMHGSTVMCGCSVGRLSSSHRDGDGCWGAQPVES